MNLKYTSALLAAGALMMACGDDTVVNVNDEAKEKGTITLRAVDVFSGKAVPNVTVYSVVDDKENTSDSLGIVTWKKKVIGSYTFFLSADGYKTVQVTVGVNEQGQGDVSRVPDVLKDVKMYKGGVEASGTVLYENEKGEKNSAAKVTVFANCGDKFVPSEVSTTTNDKGEYIFDDLPAGATCNISVGQKSIDKTLYGSTANETVASLRSGDIQKMNIITMTQIKSQLVKVSDNLKKIDSETTALNFTFSTELNADSVANKWTVTSGGTKVLTSASLGSDKKSITIKPFSGKWDKDASYSVYGTAYSKDGGKLSVPGTGSLTFKVGGGAAAAPGQVTGLKAEKGTYNYYIKLTWTAPKGEISGYYAYYKTDKMVEWKQYRNSIGATYTSTNLDTDYFISPSGFTSVEIILLPFANGIDADFSKATAVTYKVPASPVVDDEL